MLRSQKCLLGPLVFLFFFAQPGILRQCVYVIACKSFEEASFCVEVIHLRMILQLFSKIEHD